MSATLTFASYNIHKAIGLDGRRDPERILAVLREIDADIIALQEVDRRLGQRVSALPPRMVAETDWVPAPVARRAQSMGWHGNAFLVRRGIEIMNARPLDLPTIEPRGAIAAQLNWAGRSLVVYGLHLDLSGLRRRAQIRAILKDHSAHSAGQPSVMMGDFNQWGTHSESWQEIREGWTMHIPGHSFPTRRPLASLDRIVSSTGWRLIECGVHRSALSSKASDHLPVFARLQLPKI